VSEDMQNPEEKIYISVSRGRGPAVIEEVSPEHAQQLRDTWAAEEQRQQEENQRQQKRQTVEDGIRGKLPTGKKVNDLDTEALVGLLLFQAGLVNEDGEIIGGKSE
jgi:hypothetical protein